MENDFKKCSVCNEYHWTNGECKPLFYFKHEDWGDDFQEIRASDFEDAAMAFAIKYNEDGDYALMDDSTDVVISDGNVEKVFKVSAEPDIHYTVTEAKEIRNSMNSMKINKL